MTAMTSAGTTIAISAGNPATFNSAGFSALSFTDVGEVTEVSGDVGRVYSLVTHNPLATRATQKFKGSYNSGSITLPVAIDRADAGQIIAQAALVSDDDYSFKLTMQDGAVIYFRGKVMSFPVSMGGVDSITSGTITVEITADDNGNDFVEVAA